MTSQLAHRGAQLPYQVLAGVVPCSSGWLAATAKLQGITISPEEPTVHKRIIDILDYKPAFSVIALACPVGLLDKPTPKGRHCERDARKMLGRPRSSAIASAPIRGALSEQTFESAQLANGGHLSVITWRQFARIAEVDENLAPYWQRTVFEVHPELSFFQLNNDQPVKFPKRTEAGRDERRSILKARFPGVERVLDARPGRVTREQLIDAAACLWTARRIVSRAVNRLPEDPEWDELGLRMEFVR
ncbi:MAG TPA: DUF429 domain-containing protein [Acidimicrobiales bacterium]|nr:DUF429 domain-containing protein [Acidimicrobiales bacterium]